MSAAELQQATGGEWREGRTPARPLTGIGTDSRRFRDGDVFLALRGERFDGHVYARDLGHRACALIGDDRGARLWHDLPLPQLIVPDTLRALGDIAHAWRERLAETTWVAISGSVGKTSLRSMLACLLEGLGVRVAGTSGNLNNLIGVPLTLLEVPQDAEIALIECGISVPGEMERLSAIVSPDVAVLTAIAPAHGEGLGDVHGVAREKARLFSGLREDGWIAVGEGVRERLPESPRQPLLAPGDAEHVRFTLHGRRVTFALGDERTEHELELPARHWAANMALAMSIVRRWWVGRRASAPSLRDMVRALSGWQPLAGRMRILRRPAGPTVLDDAYNANPLSMQSALDTLRACEGHRVAILGDMAELGEKSRAWHAGLDVHGIQELVLIGPQMRALADRHARARWFPDADKAAGHLAGRNWPAHSVILVKGSRSTGLERLLPVILGGEDGHAV